MGARGWRVAWVPPTNLPHLLPRSIGCRSGVPLNMVMKLSPGRGLGPFRIGMLVSQAIAELQVGVGVGVGVCGCVGVGVRVGVWYCFATCARAAPRSVFSFVCCFVVLAL